MPSMCPIKIDHKTVQRPSWFFASLAALWFVSSCGVEVTTAPMERRAATDLGRPEWKGLSSTSAERFGPRSASGQGSGHTAGPSKGPEFIYDLPKGWTVADPTDLRLLNLKVAGRDDASCYLTALPRMEAGILENVNRWRGQFGAAAITADEVKSLPTTELFGLPCVRVEVSGPYSDGMGGGELSEGRLVGLIAEQDNTMVFLKMVGPKAVIDQETASFDAFVTTLTFPGAPQSGQEAPPQRTMAHDVPEGWTKQSSKAMALFGYDVPGGVKLTVTVLRSAGGGVAANVIRWRGQLGLPAIPEEEIMAGERIDCLGESGYWCRMDGSYTGMSGEAQGTQDTLMGVIVPMKEETIFIKCWGPTEAVQNVEAELRTFIASLKWETSQ